MEGVPATVHLRIVYAHIYAGLESGGSDSLHDGNNGGAEEERGEQL